MTTFYQSYFCSQRGFHERVGHSSGTATFWSAYCSICGVWLGHPAPSEAGESKPRRSESSEPSS